MPPPETLSTSMADSIKLFPKKPLKKGNLFDRNGLGGGGGVLLLVFRGKILGYVRRRTTTEPFTKVVVIDHERR